VYTHELEVVFTTGLVVVVLEVQSFHAVQSAPYPVPVTVETVGLPHAFVAVVV